MRRSREHGMRGRRRVCEGQLGCVISWSLAGGRARLRPACTRNLRTRTPFRLHRKTLDVAIVDDE